MPVRWVQPKAATVHVGLELRVPATGATHELSLGHVTVWPLADFKTIPGPGVLLVAPRGVCVLLKKKVVEYVRDFRRHSSFIHGLLKFSVYFTEENNDFGRHSCVPKEWCTLANMTRSIVALYDCPCGLNSASSASLFYHLHDHTHGNTNIMITILQKTSWLVWAAYSVRTRSTYTPRGTGPPSRHCRGP